MSEYLCIANDHHEMDDKHLDSCLLQVTTGCLRDQLLVNIFEECRKQFAPLLSIMPSRREPFCGEKRMSLVIESKKRADENNQLKIPETP
jgi:hypothetical protein